MKKSPDYEKLKNRMESSKFSGSGFLGNDRRPVDEIIADDLHKLTLNKIDKDQIVLFLKLYYQKIKAELGRRVKLDSNIYGEFFESMGRIPSPFVGDGVFEKGEAVITDEKNEEKYIITALGINLIEKHNFFQGKGSRYRLDPVKIGKLLQKLKLKEEKEE